MKDSTLQNVKRFLRIFMLVEAGAFIGRSLQIYMRYKNHPEFYALTEPWYMEVLNLGFFTGIVIGLTAIMYWFICYKIKKSNINE